MENPERITYFAETDARARRERFGIKAKDRSKHVYIVGKTGMGKSTLLENMAVQDVQNGEGLAFIDPHGSTAEKILEYIPEDRIRDVIYFAPFDLDYPIAFNVMEDVGYDKRHLVVAGLMSSFKKIWVDAWSARMEYILSNTLLALLEHPDSTLLDVNRMYTDKVFRKSVIENVKDPLVKSFWVDEFATYTDRYTQEATPAIQNKVGQFTSNPLIRNIIGQPDSTFDLREIMDNKKIFIANLSKGRIGETNADLLGSMLTTKIYLSAMSRADLPAPQQAKLPSFYFYVDEFQSIANESFADILSEARKYKLSLTIAHQYIAQMEENVRDAVFGNVGTTIAFRVGPFDAEVLETIFKPQFTMEDLVNLSFAQIYLTLMIDGVGSKPFSAATLPPIETPHVSYVDQAIIHSQKTYGRPRAEIEAAVEARTTRPDPQQQEKKEDSRPHPSQGYRPQGEKPSREPRRDSQRSRESQRPPRSDSSRSDRPRPPREPERDITPDELRKKIAEKVHKDNKQSKPKPEPKKDQTTEHRSELKNALADLMKQHEVQKKEAPKEQSAPKPNQSPPPPPKPKSHPPKPASSPRESEGSEQKEIPEAELRKILDVDQKRE